MFVDTSALFAILVEDDQHHEEAVQVWADLARRAEPVYVTGFLLAEITALLQSRAGLSVLAAFRDRLLRHLTIIWTDARLYRQGLEAAIAADRRDLSVVDCISFATMREQGIGRAFTFDPHFAEEGFEVVPEIPG